MILQLNAPLNSPSMDADTLALFIKFKSGEKGRRILVDKHGQQVFDTQGRPIPPEGAKSKYHQCNNLRGAWGTWANVNSFRAAVRLVHIMHHNHAGQNYGISQACCEQAVKGTWLANSLKRPAPPLPTPSSAAPLP